MKATLYAKLKSVATGVSNRVYADLAPQGATAPYIVYQQISGVDENTHDGYAGLQRSRWQVGCYATTAAAVETIAQQVIDGLHSYATSPVQATFRDGTVSGYEEGVGPNGAGLFFVLLDFLCWHS